MWIDKYMGSSHLGYFLKDRTEKGNHTNTSLKTYKAYIILHKHIKKLVTIASNIFRNNFFNNP